MPVVPRKERDEYRQWAKEHFQAQMDEDGWVHESDYQAFALSSLSKQRKDGE